MQGNYHTWKKCALDALYATEKYQSMSSVEREQADMKVAEDYKMHWDADLIAAAEQWKSLNRISNNKSNDKSNQ